jgi:hypothetical protein
MNDAISSRTEVLEWWVGEKQGELKSLGQERVAAPATKTRLGKTNIALSTDVLSPEILSQSFAHNNLI